MKVFESDFTSEQTDAVVEDKFCSLIDDHRLVLTKSWPKGTPISVTFSIDKEGVLAVTAVVDIDKIDFQLKITGVKNEEEISKSMVQISKMNVE